MSELKEVLKGLLKVDGEKLQESISQYFLNNPDDNLSEQISFLKERVIDLEKEYENLDSNAIENSIDFSENFDISNYEYDIIDIIKSEISDRVEDSLKDNFISELEDALTNDIIKSKIISIIVDELKK